jgi:hypothetical protein
MNKILNSSLINKILLYSARKNRTNPLALYSVLNPETNSDSPSAKSKGVRLVSAKEEVNHIIAIRGEIVIIGQLRVFRKKESLKQVIRITGLKIMIANLTS